MKHYEEKHPSNSRVDDTEQQARLGNNVIYGEERETSKAQLLLYLYRAHNKITQLSIPTHAQLRHRLKFIKNHLKNSYMFRSMTIFRELQCPR